MHTIQKIAPKKKFDFMKSFKKKEFDENGFTYRILILTILNSYKL